MSEKIYRLNERGLLLYVREDIPTAMSKRYTGTGSAFVCHREDIPIYRLNGGGLLLYVREDIPS